MAAPMPLPSDYPLHAFDKLRYGDTDRQGHVNNAVFSTLLETGRVEFLYTPEAPMLSAGCTFVIASLQLDFHREILWPGEVDIGTRVMAVGRSSITLEQALFQDGRCAATARTVVVHTNEATRRSQPLDAATAERLQALVVKES